jgi:hypothetical protein
MVNQVTTSDLNKYISRHSEETVSTITHDGLLFEALCEMIVEKNPDSTVEKLAEEYNHQEECVTVEEFVTRRFEELVHEETHRIISNAQRNKWIEYTKRGLIECGAERN